MNEKYEHIKQAVEFTNLVKCTLGPRGMNIMLVDEGGKKIMTNDGATIMKNVKGGHPIMDLFKDLARSQEVAVGDGTTTSMIISGFLLDNALNLIEKGIHPTTIIKGYELANEEAKSILKQLSRKGNKKQIIQTAFGTKIAQNLKLKLTNLLCEVKDFKDFKVLKLVNEDPEETELFNGHVFPGHNMNERMPGKISGKICAIDFQTNLAVDKFAITTAEELLKVEEADKDLKKNLVDELVANGVKCLFYTDTNPQFESYLTEAGIMGIVIFQREYLDNVCKSTNAHVAPSIDFIKSSLGESEVEYLKGEHDRKGMIYVSGENQTLILRGPTSQTLDEIERSINDVIGLMKNNLEVVTGAGSIEIEISKGIMIYAKTVGGKEQIAIEKFAESIDSIPLILAQNCGLDAIETLTRLKSIHEEDLNTFGVDEEKGISDAKNRGIIEPVSVKKYAIDSACNVCNLILKTDKLLIGEKE